MNGGSLPLRAGFFAGYAALCVLLGERMPFSRYGMFAASVPEHAILLVTADGEPVEATELAAFSGPLEPPADPGLRERLSRPPASFEDLRAYVDAHPASRAEPPGASHAFLEVQTGLGRHRSLYEALPRFLRWLLRRPALAQAPSRVEVSLESFRCREGAAPARERRVLWQGTARRVL